MPKWFTIMPQYVSKENNNLELCKPRTELTVLAGNKQDLASDFFKPINFTTYLFTGIKITILMVLILYLEGIVATIKYYNSGEIYVYLHT